MAKIKKEDDLTGYGLAASSKSATIIKFSDREAVEIHIPAYVQGDIPVENIGYAAFKESANLKRVYMPDTIRHIENSAFRSCPELEVVVTSRRLETIAQYAFAGCPKLRTITIPSDIMALPEKGFEKCGNLTEFIIWDKNKKDCPEKLFAVAAGNEHRRFGFMQASITYFDDYSMRKYDEGFPVIREVDDQLNISEYRLKNDEQLDDYHRTMYGNVIKAFLPMIIETDQVKRLTAAGELGLISEEKIDRYLEMASAGAGDCMAYLLEFKEKNFSKRDLSFEL